MAKLKWYGLVYYDGRGNLESGFLYADTDEGFVAEYAATWDPRGVFEDSEEEPGPEDFPRYEIIPLTASEYRKWKKTTRPEVGPENDGVADYETWLEHRMQP